MYSITNIFNKINIIADKKFYSHYSHFEWDKNKSFNFNKSSNTKFDMIKVNNTAEVIEFKLFGEDPCSAKIIFHRNPIYFQRYEISQKLREILPSLRPDSKIKDILLALSTYAQIKYLCDKRTIKCNDVID
jgi:hypothetical protein